MVLLYRKGKGVSRKILPFFPKKMPAHRVPMHKRRSAIHNKGKEGGCGMFWTRFLVGFFVGLVLAGLLVATVALVVLL